MPDFTDDCTLVFRLLGQGRSWQKPAGFADEILEASAVQRGSGRFCGPLSSFSFWASIASSDQSCDTCGKGTTEGRQYGRAPYGPVDRPDPKVSFFSV